MFLPMYYVYILASQPRGTLYTGVTGRIVVRISQHKQKLTEGFTSRYGVDLLVCTSLTKASKSPYAARSD